MKTLKTLLSVFVALFLLLGMMQPSVGFAMQPVFDFLQLPILQSTGLSVGRSKTITVRIPGRDYSVENTVQGSVLSIPGCTYRFDPSNPILPVYKKIIPLSASEKPVSIHTVAISAMEIKENNLFLVETPEARTFYTPDQDLISPFKREDKEESKSEPFLNTLSTEFDTLNTVAKQGIDTSSFEEVYPSTNASFSVSTCDGEKQLVLHINPVYIQNGRIFVINKITVQVDLQDTKKDELKNEKTNSSIILTADELQGAARKLADIQKEAGYEVEVISLSSCKNYSVSEKPTTGEAGFLEVSEKQREAIKSYNFRLAAQIRTMLREKLEKDAVDYLTILGDATYVPPSYYERSADGFSPIDMWVPTDLYYMSPFYAEEELTFSISVGRIPVQSPEEADKQVTKIQRYRNALEKGEPWTKGVALFGGNPFRGDYFGEVMQCETINEDIFNGNSIDKCFQTEDKFNKEYFLTSLEEGNQAFLWAMGHGSGSDFMLKSDFVSGKELCNLPEKDNLSVIVSEACGNGAWDSRLTNYYKEENRRSFAENIIYSEGAGIAYVGGARINYSDYYMRQKEGVETLFGVGGIDAMIYRFFESYSKKEGCLGDWFRESIAEYYAEDYAEAYWISPIQTKTLFGSCLLGDPTLSIPFPEESSSYEIPEITIEGESYHRLYEDLLYSIDEENKYMVKTDSPKVSYVYSNYKAEENCLIVKGETESATEEHKGTLDFLEKAYGAIRFETEDQKEKRVVFSARYSYDLQIEKNFDFRLLRPGETRTRNIEMWNDGIFPLTNVELSIRSGTDSLIEHAYTVIGRDCSQQKIMTYQANDIHTFSTEISVKSDQTKVNDKDNTVTFDQKVVEEPVYRIGVLVSPDYIAMAGYELFYLDKINSYFEAENLLIDIQPVNYFVHENGETSIDTLGFDALLLFSTLWTETNFNPIVSELERFTERGGKILGICPIPGGSAGVSLSNTSLQRFFGIQESSMIVLEQQTEIDTEFKMLEELDHFSKYKYQIQNVGCLQPKDENFGVHSWSNTDLLDTADIIGKGTQDGLALIRNGQNIYFYTGLLAGMYLEKSEDALLLFCEMLVNLQETFTDVAITSIEKQTNKPIHAGTVSKWNVQITNYGSEPSNSIVLHSSDEISIDVKPLRAHETRVVSVEYHEKSPGEKKQVLWVESDKNLLTKNDRFTLCYVVGEPTVSKEDLTITIAGISEKGVLVSSKDEYVIEGQAVPNSIIMCNNESIPVNKDGSFTYIVKRSIHGSSVTFTPVFDETKGTSLTIDMQWMKESDIYMHINDPYLLHKDDSKKIDSPPVIVNGRTVVPVSVISECFDASVAWDSTTSTATITYLNKSIALQIGNPVAVITIGEKTEEVVMETPPVIISGRTMVPLRIIATVFDAEIEWDGKAQVIHLKALLLIEEKELNGQNEISPMNEEILEEGSVSEKESEPIFTSLSDIISYAYCVRSKPEGLFVGTRSGIVCFQDKKKKECISYPKEVVQGRYSIQRYMFSAKDCSFDISSKYIVFVTRSIIYVIDRSSNTILYRLLGWENNNCLSDYHVFSRATDCRIVDEKLYIVDEYEGIRIFDLQAGVFIETVSINNGLSFCKSVAMIDNYLIGNTWYKGLFALNMETMELHTCTFEEFEGKMTVIRKDDSTVYLLYGEHYLIELRVEDIVNRDTITFDEDDFTEIGHLNKGIIGQIMCSENQMHGIILYESDSTVQLTSRFVTFTSDFSDFDDYFEENYTDCRKVKNWVPNPNSVRYLSSTNRVVVTQAYPGSEAYLHYTIQDSTRRCKVNYIEGFTGLTMDSSWGEDGLYSLFNLSIGYNEETDELIPQIGVDIYDFKQDKPKSIGDYELDFGTGDYYPMGYTFNKNDLWMYDRLKSSFLHYNVKTGELVDRVYLSEQPVSPATVGSVQLKNEGLYFLDPITRRIFLLNDKNELQVVCDYSVFVSHRNTSNLIVQGSTCYFLNNNTGYIGVIEDGQFQRWVTDAELGVQGIKAFDVDADRFLINQVSTGDVSWNCSSETERRVESKEDIHFSSDRDVYTCYPSETINGSIGLYVNGAFDTLSIKADEGVKVEAFLQQNSQQLHFSVDAPENDTKYTIIATVDGYSRDYTISCKVEEPWAEFYNHSIFCTAWNGVYWKNVPTEIESKQAWVDIQLLDTLCECDIYEKKKAYVLSFSDGKLEAEPGQDWYVFENEKGQRYRQDGTLFKKCSTGGIWVNPSFYIDLMEGNLIIVNDALKIKGKSLFTTH